MTRAIAYLDSLPDDERLRAAIALVKRSHRRAVDVGVADGWVSAEAARSHARICAHFVRAAPALVAGLVPE